jgi:starch phosphorylase
MAVSAAILLTAPIQAPHGQAAVAVHNVTAMDAVPGPPREIAYFSMEIGVDPRLPTYSGGLGVLAGDTLRSLADLKIPAIAVTLLYTNGYFRQHLDADGNQTEEPEPWSPEGILAPLDARVTVEIERRNVALRAWRYDVRGATGFTVPVIFLDASLAENAPEDRALTARLYAGDERYRLAQEAILGIGGLRMLRALGEGSLARFHLNEGHAALLPVELLREMSGDLTEVRRRCVFTTHTPVPAGHDKFEWELVARVLGASAPLERLHALGGEDRLNMTLLALNLSHYVNGVAKRHGEVSQGMFPGYPVDSITNGVHAATWASEPFRALYERHIRGWRTDPFSLRYAIKIPASELWSAHERSKAALLAEVNARTGVAMRPDVLTLGFARRATEYKRPHLVFRDPERLAAIARLAGPLQIVLAGKAHPQDESGKEQIRRIFRTMKSLPPEVKVAYLANYDMDLARLITSGSDVWLNTPRPPREASGTSGMKAAINGVPSFSVLDGWWIEGHVEGVTGWSIGPGPSAQSGGDDADDRDAADLYDKLESKIVPLYYKERGKWVDVMRVAIAFNASFFNTHRMVEQYAAHAYL